MKLSDIMKGPRLKIKRANSHIDTLVRDTAVMPDHLYQITNGPAFSQYPLAKPNGFALAYRPKEPIPEHYGAIMGDVVNNLREALDYWIRGAAECVGPRRKFHFPFSEDRKDLESSKFYVPIKKAFPDAAKFIAEEIEPCRGTNLQLWAAASLCNDNKHDDFLPVTSVLNWQVPTQVSSGTNSIGSMSLTFDANNPLEAVWSHSPISVEENFKLSVGISFPKGAVFEDQSVIPTLTNMSQVISQTLDALEKFIAPYTQ